MIVVIGNAVELIWSYAFEECNKLTNVTIGKSVRQIEMGAFEGTALTSLYSLNPTPPRIGEYNFTGDQYRTTNVYVPEEALEAYQNAEKWKGFRNLQGFDPTGIKDVEVDGVKGDGKYYDLRGNKLDAPKHGINIINGKKVVVK